MTELRRILHVDDDEDVCEIAKLSLEIIGGFEVFQFNSGPEVLADDLSFAPQIFLFDLMMPGMSGEELWKTLRQREGLEDIPVIFLTVKVDNKQKKQLFDEGASAVFTKPFDPEDLCKQVQEVWANKSPVTDRGVRFNGAI